MMNFCMGYNRYFSIIFVLTYLSFDRNIEFVMAVNPLNANASSFTPGQSSSRPARIAYQRHYHPPNQNSRRFARSHDPEDGLTEEVYKNLTEEQQNRFHHLQQLCKNEIKRSFPSHDELAMKNILQPKHGIPINKIKLIADHAFQKFTLNRITDVYINGYYIEFQNYFIDAMIPSIEDFCVEHFMEYNITNRICQNELITKFGNNKLQALNTCFYAYDMDELCDVQRGYMIKIFETYEIDPRMPNVHVFCKRNFLLKQTWLLNETG